jgi:GR25 family glycosyltransferase involved in LPS biosynthesis
MFDIYVINLEERTDRMEKIKEIFRDFNIIRINAIKHENGVIGCFLSHLECIKIAKQNNLKNIFVIEDDCIPFYTEKDFINRLCKIKKILDELEDWDIFLGSTNTVFTRHVINKIYVNDEHFLKVTRGKTAHMICYNEKVYDTYLNTVPYINSPIDKFWHDKFTAIIPIPYIASQDDGFSDILNKDISYEGRITNSNTYFVNYLKEFHIFV